MAPTTVYIAECPRAWGKACKVGATDDVRGLLATLPTDVKLVVHACHRKSTEDLLPYFDTLFIPRPELGPDFFEGDRDDMEGAARVYVGLIDDLKTAISIFLSDQGYEAYGRPVVEVYAHFVEYITKKRGRPIDLDKGKFIAQLVEMEDVSLTVCWRAATADLAQHPV